MTREVPAQRQQILQMYPLQQHAGRPNWFASGGGLRLRHPRERREDAPCLLSNLARLRL